MYSTAKNSSLSNYIGIRNATPQILQNFAKRLDSAVFLLQTWPAGLSAVYIWLCCSTLSLLEGPSCARRLEPFDHKLARTVPVKTHQ